MCIHDDMYINQIGNRTIYCAYFSLMYFVFAVTEHARIDKKYAAYSIKLHETDRKFGNPLMNILFFITVA